MRKFVGKRIAEMKREGRRIVSITAYDLFTATVAREAAVDFVLVGDSLANVVQGHDTTVPVTIEDVVYHTKIVVRVLGGRLPVFADMPFGSFKLSTEATVENAVRVFKATGCDGIKLEGATEDNLEAIARLIEIGIPVMGHTGFLPQTVHTSGGYRYRGKTATDREAITGEAVMLSNAGCCAVVLECVKPAVASEITGRIKAPTIGIGSGPDCDGQILVIHDLLGMFESPPGFITPYARFLESGAEALSAWSSDVREGTYPPPGTPVKASVAKKDE